MRRSAIRNAGRNVMTKTTVTTNNIAAVLRFAITELSDFDLVVDTFVFFFFFCVDFASEQCYTTPQLLYRRQSLLKTGENKDQTNEAKSGIARLHSSGGSSNLQLHVLAAGFDHQISSPPWGISDPIQHCTQSVIGLVHKCTCQTVSKSVERFTQGARMLQTDRPRYGEMCRNRRNRFRLKSWRTSADLLLRQYLYHVCYIYSAAICRII